MLVLLLLLSATTDWTVADYDDGGKIRCEDNVVYLDQTDGFTGANYTGKCPHIDYEITLDAMRISGEDFFCGLTFPYKGDYCTLIIGGWGGRLVGLSCIDGMDAFHNDTHTYRDFKSRQWYSIRLRVTPDRIQTWIDGNKVIDCYTAGHRVSIRPDIAPSKPFGIASYFTGAAFRNFSINPIK